MYTLTSPKAIFMYFEALARGVEPVEAERLAAAVPAATPAPRRVFDLAWRDAPHARERARALVAAFFVRHPGAGDFFVDERHVCIRVRPDDADRLVRELVALDASRAIARLEPGGPIATAAFRPTWMCAAA